MDTWQFPSHTILSRPNHISLHFFPFATGYTFFFSFKTKIAVWQLMKESPKRFTLKGFTWKFSSISRVNKTQSKQLNLCLTAWTSHLCNHSIGSSLELISFTTRKMCFPPLSLTISQTINSQLPKFFNQDIYIYIYIHFFFPENNFSFLTFQHQYRSMDKKKEKKLWKVIASSPLGLNEKLCIGD